MRNLLNANKIFKKSNLTFNDILLKKYQNVYESKDKIPKFITSVLIQYPISLDDYIFLDTESDKFLYNEFSEQSYTEDKIINVFTQFVVKKHLETRRISEDCTCDFKSSKKEISPDTKYDKTYIIDSIFVIVFVVLIFTIISYLTSK